MEHITNEELLLGYWVNTGFLIAFIALAWVRYILDRLKRDTRMVIQYRDSWNEDTRTVRGNNYEGLLDRYLPQYATTGSSGRDIYLKEDLMIGAGGTVIIDTGLYVVIPSGYELQVRSRSGKGAKGLIVAQGIGTIDNDYRGEIKVALHNRTEGYISLKQGDAVAQLVLSPVKQFDWERISQTQYDELSTDRGIGGFGSTDKPKQ